MKAISPILIMLTLFQHPSYSQDQHRIDSLASQLKNHNAHKLELGKNATALYDTTAAKILNKLSESYRSSKPDEATEYAKQSLELSEQIGYKKGMGNAYNSMGSINNVKGDYIPALEFHKKALEIRKEIGDQKGIAGSYGNIGNIYMNLGNYTEALNNYFAGLKIEEAVDDQYGMALSYNGIGGIYSFQGNYPEALKNHYAALKIEQEIGDKDGMANTYNNIGIIYHQQGKYSEALKYYNAALKIREEIGDQFGTADAYNNIGALHFDLGNRTDVSPNERDQSISLALNNYSNALKISEEMGDKEGTALSCNNIGDVFIKEKKYTDASLYLNRALSLSKEIGSLEDIKASYFSLSNLDSAQGNFKQALEHYKLHIIFSDSLVNNESTKKTVQLQMQYNFDKKQVADSLKFAQEKEVGTLLLQRQKAITYTGFVGVAVTLLFLVFVYRSYNQQRLANQKLKEAQEQLIKSEKMAAFGVMASRVSHEILNPLNFVNNFSELSQEMVSDVILSKNDNEKKEHADLLIANLQKINEQGKKAAGIVKQLQEHSSKGTAHDFFETN